MSQIVPPLAAILADFPDFRDPRGVRHPLVAVLLLSCVAMLYGARGESAIAEWAKNCSATWRAPLGFTRPDGPSQSTVQRASSRARLRTAGKPVGAVGDADHRLLPHPCRCFHALRGDGD